MKDTALQYPLEDDPRFLAALLDVSALLVVVLDPAGRILRFNRACEALTGYTADQLQGEPLGERLLVPEEVPSVQAVIDAVGAGYFPNEHDNRWLTRAGDARWIHWKNTALTDATGQVECIIGTGIDITERRHAEAALQEAHQQSQAILDTAADAIITIDTSGTIQGFNRAAETIFGYVAPEVIGANVACLMPPPYCDEHDAYLQRYLATGEAQIIGFPREVTGQRKDGTLFPCELAVAEVALPHKYLFTGIIRDLTARKEAERAARQRLDELAHVGRQAAMGDLASGLAHELSQPLTAVTSYAQAARQRLAAAEGESSRLTSTLDQIITQSQRAGKLIRHLRSFLARGAGQREWVDLNDLIRAAVELLDYELERHQVRLRLSLDGTLPPLALERLPIEQVVLNLARNAIEAMAAAEAPERELSLTTGWAEADQTVAVAVADTGPGLSETPVEKLFEPFFTTKPDGLGQGLSMSRSIIAAHGGRLEVTSPSGSGATLTVLLPVSQEGG